MTMFIDVDSKAGLLLAAALVYLASAILFPEMTAQTTSDAISTVQGWLP